MKNHMKNHMKKVNNLIWGLFEDGTPIGSKDVFLDKNYTGLYREKIDDPSVFCIYCGNKITYEKHCPGCGAPNNN